MAPCWSGRPTWRALYSIDAARVRARSSPLAAQNLPLHVAHVVVRGDRWAGQQQEESGAARLLHERRKYGVLWIYLLAVRESGRQRNAPAHRNYPLDGVVHLGARKGSSPDTRVRFASDATRVPRVGWGSVAVAVAAPSQTVKGRFYLAQTVGGRGIMAWFSSPGYRERLVHLAVATKAAQCTVRPS